MIKKRSLTVLFLLLIIQLRLSAQLSFQVDSISLSTLNDYPAELASEDVIDESYDAMLEYGPHIRIYGKLVNSSHCPVIYYASTDKKLLTETIIKTSFIYRGRNYETKHCCSGMGDVFIPVSTKSKSGELFCTDIGRENIHMFFIPEKGIVSFDFGSSFLYYSKWGRFNSTTRLPENERYKIKNNRKLEKIAKEVLPTIQVSVSINNHWEAWSELLVEGSRVLE